MDELLELNKLAAKKILKQMRAMLEEDHICADTYLKLANTCFSLLM